MPHSTQPRDPTFVSPTRDLDFPVPAFPCDTPSQSPFQVGFHANLNSEPQAVPQSIRFLPHRFEEECIQTSTRISWNCRVLWK